MATLTGTLSNIGRLPDVLQALLHLGIVTCCLDLVEALNLHPIERGDHK